MRRFKKIAAVAAMFALALSTFACGKKDDEKTTDTGTETVQTGGDATDTVLDDGDWPTTEAAVIEEERFITVEGEDVIGINFDDNELHGFVTYENGGKYALKAENGEMVADIERTGSVEHGCQLYFDGFTMAKGCEYTLSFDVSSTVDRIVEWRVQINGGDYHAYSSNKVNLTSEKQTVTQTFVMEENSDPAPRFVVNMGAFEGMGEVGAHQIHFDNISLIVSDSSNAEEIKGAPIPIPVKVNQIGYRPDDVKTVITTSDADEKFKIVDAKTDETVYVGKYNEGLVYDVSVSSVVKIGDFTEVKTPGTYKVLSSPSGYSYEFSIGDNLYDDIYKDVVLMLYNQRCGSKLDSGISGDFAHEACHMGDAVVYGSTETRSVTGGWHDAGDYGRYVVPGAKTVQDLLLAYEDYNYTDDNIGIPESGNEVPDLLDEARYELEWMLKMQDEKSGGVYHKVTALVFPETVLAVDETDQMVLAPISYAATADFAAVMAKASVIYKDFDAEFASACLDAAVKAYGYMEADPDNKKIFKNPEDIVTGEYPDAQLEDEFLWASSELYIATGDDKYKTAVSTALDGNFMKGLGWASIGTYAIYDLAKADGIDDNIKSKANDMVVATADKLINTCEDSAFSIGLNSSFPWGSNMTVANDGMLFLMTARLTGDNKYLEYAQKHRDYIFGTNGTAYCYVTGYGTLSPNGTHHRPSQVLGKTMPGMLVGGPDSNLEDPYAVAVLTGLPAALSYVDNDQSFSCNEVTIYWNSPLIYLMTGLK